MEYTAYDFIKAQQCYYIQSTSKYRMHKTISFKHIVLGFFRPEILLKYTLSRLH